MQADVASHARRNSSDNRLHELAGARFVKVEFLQKVYAENVLDHQHQVWDVHTNVDRWWVNFCMPEVFEKRRVGRCREILNFCGPALRLLFGSPYTG